MKEDKMIANEQTESEKDRVTGVGIGLAIGCGFGIIFGMLTPSIGIPVGLALGAAFGLILGNAFTPKRKGKSGK